MKTELRWKDHMQLNTQNAQLFKPANSKQVWVDDYHDDKSPPPPPNALGWNLMMISILNSPAKSSHPARTYIAATGSAPFQIMTMTWMSHEKSIQE